MQLPPTLESQLEGIAGPSPKAREPLRGAMGVVVLVWARRSLLWRLCSRAFLAAIVLALLLPKSWESTVRLMPPESAGGSGLAALAMAASSTAESLPVPGMAELLNQKNDGALFAGILRSRTVADGLIDSFDLRRVYRVSTYERAREILEERTLIVEDRRSGIISVTVADRDSVRARDLCTAYVDGLDRLVARVSTSAARRERMFLEERLREVNIDLNHAAKELSEFSSKHATLDISVQGKAMLDAAATVQGQLIAAESELKSLQTLYTDDNVRVRSVRARIAELVRQLKQLGGAEGQSAAPTESDELYPSIRQLPLLAVKYEELYRRAKMQGVLYETLTKQFELAKVEEAKEIPSVRVLDVPMVPERKASPKRLQIVFAGTTLAFLFGTVWIWASAMWHRTDAEDPRKRLAAEVYNTASAGLLNSISGLRNLMARPGIGKRFRRK